MDSKEFKEKVIASAEKAVEELLKVIEEPIIQDESEDKSNDLSADRLKNAAATKKLAIFDCLDIIDRVEDERNKLDAVDGEDKKKEKKEEKQRGGFAERHAKKD